MEPARILADVAARQAAGEEPPELLLDLAFRYAAETRPATLAEYETGYPVGDEILRELAREIQLRLPAYPPRQLAAFLRVLGDLVRYAYRAATQPRQFFAHLYDPGADQEALFQNHLYLALTAGSRAARYSYESADKIGSGRMDIVYAEDGLLFPIEVKKQDTPPDWPSIEANYLAQAQTYVHAYHQLGLLVVFDLSPKKGQAPINNIREHFAVLHLEPYYQLGGTRPDYLVVCLIPGNKVAPSSYTTYSSTRR